jgi:threonylcarbamoyladenosine tRNA methylthiotransferase MtaB
MRTCAFYTLGCKVNQYETQSIRESFGKAGYREVNFSEPADVYVINTCTVTAKTDKESRRLVREAHRKNPSALIVPTGCYVECDEGEIRNIPGVNLVVKNKDKDEIVNIVRSGDHGLGRASGKDYLPLSISDFKDRTKAFLKVQEGCDNFCSYCKVPLVRGRSRSRDIKSTIAEMRRLVSKGFKEIVLTGICLGAWGADLLPKKSFDELVECLIKLDGDFRIRLSSIEPKYVNTRLLSLIKSTPKLCKHLHIPLQSGDDDILKAMNRPYTADKYVDIVKRIRRMIPDIAITTDILLGFPGETESRFRSTYKLVKEIKPSRIHIFSYSERKGAAASRLERTVSKEEVKRRLNRMRGLALEISYKYRKDFLHKTTKVLVESERDKETGLLKGYDDKYMRILLEGPDSYKSRIMPSKIQRVETERTFGKSP